MKRLFALLLALLMLLTACAGQPEQTAPADTTEPTTLPPTEPQSPPTGWDGFYEPDSIVEILTSGAVKKYVPDVENVYAVAAMGDGILLFSGEEDTELTYLGPDGERYSAALTGCYLYPDGQITHVADDGICYYDDSGNAVVYLNGSLQEMARISLPFPIVGGMVLSPDGEAIYYFAEDSLHWLELRTGISRMLKQTSFDYQEVTGLHFDGDVLECFVSKDGNEEVLYISAKTGQTLFSTPSIPTLHTSGKQYFAQWKEGSVRQWIFGSRGQQKKSLLLENEELLVSPMFNMGGVMTQKTDCAGSTLEYYHLENGSCSATVRMAGVGHPWSMAEDATHSRIWFLAYGIEADSPVALYSWDPALSPTDDTQNYVSPYYTELEPDNQGLKEIQQQAKALGERYGVRIRVWQDAADTIPSDYTFTPEYLVQAYQRSLPILENALASFPEGFFKKLGSQSNNRTLTICLIRGAYGSNELGSLEEADGVHFWNNGNSYMALTMGDHMKQTFYHELFHSIDSYILTETLAFDFWDDLNPEGFRYDYSYVTNQYREDYQYLEEGSRSFIDMYSMSYPKEDRARIMEYAVMEDCGEYFESDTMQAKLGTICKGIREAFGLKKDKRVFLWEQYLKEPI